MYLSSTSQNGQIYTVEMNWSSTGQNGWIYTVEMYLSSIGQKDGNLHCRVVLVKYGWVCTG